MAKPARSAVKAMKSGRKADVKKHIADYTVHQNDEKFIRDASTAKKMWSDAMGGKKTARGK